MWGKEGALNEVETAATDDEECVSWLGCTAAEGELLPMEPPVELTECEGLAPFVVGPVVRDPTEELFAPPPAV